MKKNILLLLVAPIVLLGAGCTSVATGCGLPTTHGSCIEEGIDPALVGTWRLDEESIGSSAGTFIHPYSGRLLSFSTNLEELLDGDGNASGHFETIGSFVDEYATENDGGFTVMGVSNGCVVSGAVGGDWSAETEMVSSDPTDPSAPLVAVNQLTAISNAVYSQPKITCPMGAGSNKPSTPLGESSPGPYQYTISGDGTLLMITQSNPFANTTIAYQFSKVVEY